ncbi:hypothetical protein [Salinirussus salinus]|uniref:hypothetical protein n=1 Tax=Salinirussus salinus TaxID=1198300 RepID=UPI001356C77E|nr:hypothetical protein [Salinirussus salinus]
MIILTTVRPNPSTGSRPEKLAYRCSKLIEAGYRPIVVSHALSYHSERVAIGGGEVQYHGPKIRKDYGRPDSAIDEDRPGNRSTLTDSLSSVAGLIDKLSPIDPILKFAPTTYHKLKKILKSENPSALVTQTYPFTTNVLGYVLSKEIETLSWIIEYRDPWLNNPIYFPEGPNTINKILEKRCINQCDRLTYYEGLQIPESYFEDKYPELKSKITSLGYMGFDEKKAKYTEPKQFSKFTLTYAGTLHTEGYDISSFLKGLSEFIVGNNISSDSFQVIFLGDSPRSREHKQILDDYIVSPGWVEVSEALSYVMGSDFAIYLNATRPRDQYNISQKMWDYVGCQTPIFCLSRPGWASYEFVNSKGIGICVDLENKSSIVQGLSEAYKTDGLQVPDSLAQEFTRAQSEGRFVEALGEAINRRERVHE